MNTAVRTIIPLLTLIFSSIVFADIPNDNVSKLDNKYRNHYLYRAQLGETPESIAFDFLKEAADKTKRQQFYTYNHIAANDTAKTVKPNQIFRLPVDWMYLKPVNAIMLSTKGNVQVIHQNTQLPLSIIPEGSTIKTGKNSFALIEFPDRSLLTVSPDSDVLLATVRRYAKSDIFNIHIHIEQGRAESQVKPLHHPSSDYTVKSKRLSTAVRGTRFSVSDMITGYATTEVLEGGVQLNAITNQDNLILVSKGLGVYTKDSKLPTLTTLLPAPQWDCTKIEGITIDQPLPIIINQATHLFKLNIYSESSLITPLSIDQLNTTVPDIQTLTTQPILPAELKEGTYTVQVSAVDQYGLQGFNSVQRLSIKNKPPTTPNWLYWIKNNKTQSWVLLPLPNTHFKQVFCLK